MSAGEIIDVLNEAGEVVDTISRDQAERDNHITENVLVFVFNSVGRVWVQLRPQTKNHYPGKWDISACGGILSGETRDQAAKRETGEEMGFEVELHYIESFLNIFPGDNGEIRKRLSHLYIGFSDAQPVVSEEVDEFKDWKPEELRIDLEAHPDSYIPSFIVELDKAVEGYKKLH
jgi:isopentenyl-diphosphate Delta-isomerase